MSAAPFHDVDLLPRQIEALGRCVFPPGSPPKRFARQIQGADPGTLSEAQRHHVVRLSYRYRRQMPEDLVPRASEVAAIDAHDTAVRAAKARAAAEAVAARRKPKPPVSQADLLSDPRG
jgi:hypothetical protein